MTPGDKLRLTLQWVQARINGEMIETTNYRRNYLGFEGSVSQRELDAICGAVNLFYMSLSSPIRITNAAGEIIPAHW
jgi:hypothetical protein